MVADAKALTEGGVDALMMENFGDVTKWEVTEWDDVVYSNKIKQ